MQTEQLVGAPFSIRSLMRLQPGRGAGNRMTRCVGVGAMMKQLHGTHADRRLREVARGRGRALIQTAPVTGGPLPRNEETGHQRNAKIWFDSGGIRCDQPIAFLQRWFDDVGELEGAASMSEKSNDRALVVAIASSTGTP